PSVLVLDDLDLLVASEATDQSARRMSAELRELLEYAPVSGVFVIGCVRLGSALPPVVRRSGRFDHHISLMPPCAADRRAIVEHHVTAHAGLEFADDIELDVIAEATPLMTAADLASVVREAARRAMDIELKTIVIGQAHLLSAVSRQRRSLSLPDVEGWLDAVRGFPGNEEPALALDTDTDAFKTGRGELATMDVSHLLPAPHEIRPTETRAFEQSPELDPDPSPAASGT
ncbi:MAG: ATP-binding protein, partial [Nannocystaceae bacterium]|nr:ATP-binding protein [Nannocystaceae bacterium]